MSDQPVPWTCLRCGTRLQWRWNALHCLHHGDVAMLPPWPDRQDDEPSSF